MPAAEPTTQVRIPMPQLGESVDEGTILEWLCEPGSDVEEDQLIAEISTDKVDADLTSPVSGTLVEILVRAGETVNVGVAVATISTSSGAPEQPVETSTPSQPVDTSPEPASPRSDPPKSNGDSAPSPSTQRGRQRLSPLVRRIAAANGLNLDEITGSGLGGRVTKRDVNSFIENAGRPQAQPAPATPRPTNIGGPADVNTLSALRQTIASRMVASRSTAAHCHSWIEIDMGRVEQERQELRFSPLPFVARATIGALQIHPGMNAWLEGEKLTKHNNVNLGIAVALGGEGLIVPVIKDAQDLSIEGLAASIKDVAKRAREKNLKPDDVQGATFTITNQGVFGTYMSAPIINIPQVGILDLQTITKRVMVVDDEDGNDSMKIRPMTVLGLSWDHRALDGAQAGAFLAEIRRRLETWSRE